MARFQLAGYKPETQRPRTQSAVAVFKKFIDYKTRRVQTRTLEKYHGLVTWLTEFYGDRLSVRTEGEASESATVGWDLP